MKAPLSRVLQLMSVDGSSSLRGVDILEYVGLTRSVACRP